MPTAADVYAAYPRKVGRAAAIKAANRAIAEVAKRPGMTPAAAAAWLLDRVRAYAATREGQDPKFTPHPATWFGQGRYDDEPETVRPGPAGSPRDAAAPRPPATHVGGSPGRLAAAAQARRRAWWADPAAPPPTPTEAHEPAQPAPAPTAAAPAVRSRPRRVEDELLEEFANVPDAEIARRREALPPALRGFYEALPLRHPALLAAVAGGAA